MITLCQVTAHQPPDTRLMLFNQHKCKLRVHSVMEYPQQSLIALKDSQQVVNKQKIIQLEKEHL